MLKKYISAIFVAFIAVVGIYPNLANAQLWRQFAHPNQPHPGINGPIRVQELFDNPNAVVQRPVLVVLMEFTDVKHQSAHNVGYFEDMFFGQNRANGRPSVAENYRANSNGRLLLVPATDGDLDGAKDGIVGWQTTPHTYDDFCCDDIEIKQKRAEAIRIADPLFNYSLYDKPPHGNGDGVITKDELVVVLINAAPGTGANVRATDPAQVSVEGNTLVVSQAMAAAAEHENVGTLSHELGHQLLGLGDLYHVKFGGGGCQNYYMQVEDGYLCDSPDNWFPPPPGRYSMMDNSPPDIVSHVDPWAKIHLGFVKPLVIAHDGTYTLYDAESERNFATQDTRPEAIIIYDPLRSDAYKEYFILENRNLNSPLLDRGLAVWLINENETELRKVIRLIRKSGHWTGSPMVWDGADPNYYDLTVSSRPRNTNWTDTTKASYIEITDISPAGPAMTFKVTMPPIFVDKANSGSENGSQANPFNTVLGGVNAVPEPPRTIRIAGGSYPENLVINTPVTLKGWRNGNAVIGQ